MEKWVFTGVSGCGRIEFLREIQEALSGKGVRAKIHDLGMIIRKVCRDNNIEFDDAKILDVEASTLRLARALALKELDAEILKDTASVLHLIGVHLTFRWKGRIIPGFTVKEIATLHPNGFVNVVDNIESIHDAISTNPKWSSETRIPDFEEIQYWLMEEEFVTEMLAELVNCPMYLVARKHSIQNISQLFVDKKKKIYLSYPITAIRDSNPGVLKDIQGKYLEMLQELFIVFNPLDIEDHYCPTVEIRNSRNGL
jgi:hypothetical protein